MSGTDLVIFLTALVLLSVGAGYLVADFRAWTDSREEPEHIDTRRDDFGRGHLKVLGGRDE